MGKWQGANDAQVARGKRGQRRNKHKGVNDAQEARSKRSTRDNEQKKHKRSGAKEAQETRSKSVCGIEINNSILLDLHHESLDAMYLQLIFDS